MIKIISIVTIMFLSSNNSFNREFVEGVSCSIIKNVIKYIKESDKEFKGKNIAVFDTTDALPFAYFSQEMKLHYPSITSQIIDSLDHNSIPRKIDCANNESNPIIELVFSNLYKNLIICEWFYVEGPKTQNLNDIRRFKDAKIYFFELGDNYQIKQVFIKTVQYE